MFVRKELAGSTSTGHTWDRDGQIIEVPDEVGAELVAIQDAGFSEVARDDLPAGWDQHPADKDDPGRSDGDTGDGGKTGGKDGDEGKKPEQVTEPGPAETVTEPDPAAGKKPADETPAKPARGRGGAKPKE